MSDKPTIAEVAPLLRAYYAKPGNSMGGVFHIITEDGNYEDHFAQECLTFAREDGDPEGIALGELLVRMSGTQRKKLSRMSFYPWSTDHA